MIFMKKRDLRDSYKRVFETPDGQIVLRHLMRVGLVTSTTFVKGDPTATAMNEGMRRIVLSIMHYALKDQQEMEEQLTESIQDENTVRS